MTGKIYLLLFFSLAFWASAIVALGRKPQEVTRWDSAQRKVMFKSPNADGASEFGDKSTCSSFRENQGNNTIVDWGLTIPNGTEGVPCSEGNECVDFGVAKVTVTYEDNCERIHWVTSDLEELKDCVYLLGHWYGGGQQFTQPWPIETNPRVEVAFVTSDMLGKPWTYGGVTERFWVSSEGIAVQVENTIPLFFSVVDTDEDGRADQMCLSSKFEPPYVEVRPTLNLTYYVCYADDVRQVYDLSFAKFFSFPRSIPDERMLTHPVWSTWAEYATEVNDTRVLDLAQTILDQGFDNSQIEIDDKWETCYGDAIFDAEKFPDPKAMVDTLHSMGYRVTVWVHPFINDDCESFAFADQNGYFLKNNLGQTQLTSWWKGESAGLIDFSNKEASTWWTQRLNTLKNDTGLDSFKIDAGETSWMPDDYTLDLSKEYWPDAYTPEYVKAVSPFGTMIEVRVGHDSETEPVFVRMLDKYSLWSDGNGLKTMIPTLLHSGLVGYPFVLPDMVGGNAYSGKPSSELFIRWAQVNTFMPSIQFSLLPWEFDSDVGDVAQISRDVVSLHAQFAPLIIELAQNSTLGAGPITRPTWWLCPTDEDCLLANQQFLLGDDILVTPVIEESATAIEVVFPPGTWKSSETGTLYEGLSKQIISNLTINSNVYFQRVL